MLYHILLSFIMLYYICARVHVTVAMHASICAMAKAWWMFPSILVCWKA